MTAMRCKQIEALLTQFVMGDLDPAQEAEVRSHLETCEGCQNAAREIELTLDLLRNALAAGSQGNERLSAEHRARVLHPVQQRLIRWPRPAISSAVAALLIVGFIVVIAGLLLPNLGVVSERARRVTLQARTRIGGKVTVLGGDSLKVVSVPEEPAQIEMAKLDPAYRDLRGTHGEYPVSINGTFGEHFLRNATVKKPAEIEARFGEVNGKWLKSAGLDVNRFEGVNGELSGIATKAGSGERFEQAKIELGRFGSAYDKYPDATRAGSGERFGLDAAEKRDEGKKEAGSKATVPGEVSLFGRLFARRDSTDSRPAGKTAPKLPAKKHYAKNMPGDAGSYEVKKERENLDNYSRKASLSLRAKTVSRTTKAGPATRLTKTKAKSDLDKTIRAMRNTIDVDFTYNEKSGRGIRKPEDMLKSSGKDRKRERFKDAGPGKADRLGTVVVGGFETISERDEDGEQGNYRELVAEYFKSLPKTAEQRVDLVEKMKAMGVATPLPPPLPAVIDSGAAFVPPREYAKRGKSKGRSVGGGKRSKLGAGPAEQLQIKSYGIPFPPGASISHGAAFSEIRVFEKGEDLDRYWADSGKKAKSAAPAPAQIKSAAAAPADVSREELHRDHGVQLGTPVVTKAIVGGKRAALDSSKLSFNLEASKKVQERLLAKPSAPKPVRVAGKQAVRKIALDLQSFPELAAGDDLMEATKKLGTRMEDMEMWLMDQPNRGKRKGEQLDKSEIGKMPMVPLPAELEDLIGDLLERQEEEIEDEASGANTQGTADMTVGWDVMEGEMDYYSAKGKSGNDVPDAAEKSGRSGVGREGKSEGETVAASGEITEGDDNIEKRMTQDPILPGSVKQEVHKKAKATGGGKESGYSNEKGMPGLGPRTRAVGVNPFVAAAANRFSTFSIDLDTASYTMARSYLSRNILPLAELVRTEEFINFFDYNYPAPAGKTFAVYIEDGLSPFGRGLNLLKIGIKGRRLGREEQRPLVLTLLVDTSGSMAQADRIKLIKTALLMLIKHLDPADRVAIIQYSDHARLVLPHTAVSQKKKILKVIKGMQTSGSTNLEEGLQLAYATAARGFRGGSLNRVLLLSDGMANLGTVQAEGILKSVKKYRKQGITCSIYGFGTGNYNDVMLESLAAKGDGIYAFIDSRAEAKRKLVDEFADTVNLIARDVKIQVEFNPKRVLKYRQLGYENRALSREEFRDDSVDAGEIGSGQSVTALYELELQGSAREPVGTVRVRWRDARTGVIDEVEAPITIAGKPTAFKASNVYFRLAAGVAEFAEILRGSPFARGSKLEDVARVLQPVAKELTLDQRIQELILLVNRASAISASYK